MFSILAKQKKYIWQGTDRRKDRPGKNNAFDAAQAAEA